MFVELVTTGSELLLGEITNYNSAYLSRKLNEIGYSVIYHTRRSATTRSAWKKP